MTLPFLRIRPNGLVYPYSVTEFRADEPQLSISNDPHDGELASYATLDPPVIVCRPKATDPPEHDPATHQAVEVMPVQDEDGIWRQAWELQELPPPPPPGPDWLEFRTAIRSENGFYDAYCAALQADPMVVPLLGPRLDDFERDGNFSPFLESLTLTLQALPSQEAAHIAMEFLALASRCGLPAAFLDALQTLFPEPAP